MVDLRKAKPGDVYEDGYGYKVRILCTDRNNGANSYNVVALKKSRYGDDVIMTYTLDGQWLYGEEIPNDHDLVKLIEVNNDEQNLSVQQYLISKGYPVNTGGDIPTYDELYEIIKDGIIDAIKKQSHE